MNIAYLQMHDMGPGSWLFAGFGAVIVWTLVIWTVVALVRGRTAENAAPTAAEVLDRRLASGEISTAEYGRLRDALRTRTGPTTTHH